MTIIIGNIATNDNFFDRVREREDLWAILPGSHVVLGGPRRLGKSSLMRQLEEEAPEHGLLAVWVDVEGLESAEQFIAAIDAACPASAIRSFLQSAGGAANRWLSRFKKFEVKVPGGFGGGVELQAQAQSSWREKADALQKRLVDQPVLLLINEVSVFLERLLQTNPEEAKSLLGWLRQWRQQPEQALRMVYTGSIGLNALLNQFQLGTFSTTVTNSNLAHSSCQTPSTCCAHCWSANNGRPTKP